MISLLLTILKKHSTSRPVIMDLSFPVSCSVNDGVSKDTFLGEPFQLCLPGVKALASLIRAMVRINVHAQLSFLLQYTTKMLKQ